jgi:hypothetical protein
LRGGSKWMGVCTQTGDGSIYPQIMTVEARTSGRWSG